ncbi:hypothetical protein [Metabacillus litoralis]|uniref:hypothetical protein n=1 Tax=Metabacillus litoralis TaxID=152268 RepID=UPI00203B8B02|nr:hypothetical protein [Metabacillus litoralis]MCM3409937.1 hypothetical protein [Metabacillus litoralis]
MILNILLLLKEKHEDIQNYHLALNVPWLDIHEYKDLKFLMDEPCTLNIVVRTAKTIHHDYYVDHHFSIHLMTQMIWMMGKFCTPLEQQLLFMESLYSEEVIYIFDREPNQEERMKNANYTMTLKGHFDQYTSSVLYEIINAIISNNGGQMKVVDWSGVDI